MSIYLIYKNSMSQLVNDQQTNGKQCKYTNNFLVKKYKQADWGEK